MSSETWTVKSILAWIEGYLADHGDPNPRLSAQWLVSDALGMSRIQLYTDFARPLTLAERDVLRDYTRRRGTGEPLQYITGTTDFRFITVSVRPGVLIPRPETEVLVSEALADVRMEDPFVLDLCTGTGCIACAIATEFPNSRVVATDIDGKAVALARKNADDLGVSERVEVLQCDLASGVDPHDAGHFDLLISNPPYIPTDVLESLEAQVSDFEPALALDGGDDGLDVFRRILPVATNQLANAGVLAVELHEECLDTAAVLAADAGFSNVRIARDLADRPRVLIASKGAKDE